MVVVLFVTDGRVVVLKVVFVDRDVTVVIRLVLSVDVLGIVVEGLWFVDAITEKVGDPGGVVTLLTIVLLNLAVDIVFDGCEVPANEIPFWFGRADVMTTVDWPLV